MSRAHKAKEDLWHTSLSTYLEQDGEMMVSVLILQTFWLGKTWASLRVTHHNSASHWDGPSDQYFICIPVMISGGSLYTNDLLGCVICANGWPAGLVWSICNNRFAERTYTLTLASYVSSEIRIPQNVTSVSFMNWSIKVHKLFLKGHLTKKTSFSLKGPRIKVEDVFSMYLEEILP